MTSEIREHNGLQYLIHFPEHYDESKTYPVLLYLHGAGSRSGIQTLYNCALIREAQKREDFPFIIIAPYCAEHSWVDLWEHLKAFVKMITAAPYTDKKRLYLTGASMGGYATWQLAMSMPEYFAAIAPICGGGLYAFAGRLVNIPVWAFHGALDKTVYVEESEKMVDAINRCGGNAKLTIYPENAHDSWSDTYANSELYAWLLQHENSNALALIDEYNDAKAYG